MTDHDLNDSLSDLLAGEFGKYRTAPVAPVAIDINAPRVIPVYKSAEQRFEEGCPKCNGRGRFISYSGRDVGPCFACKGAGKKVFKTSPMTREQNREKSAMKKASSIAESITEFNAAYPAVHAWLVAECSKAKPFEFAVAMVEALNQYGSLTERQLATCERLAAKAAERATQASQRRADAPSVDVSAIERAFATAREKAARPSQIGIMVKPLNLSAGPLKTDIAFKCSPGSIGSQWEGQIFFKSLDDRKLGYVKAGKFIRQFACTDAEAQAVVTVASDPKAGLMAYAKAWSRCGVCGRGLLNDVSIERGIGPICLAKYGF